MENLIEIPVFTPIKGKRRSSEVPDSLRIEISRTPTKQTKLQDNRSYLTNTEKSVAYLKSKLKVEPSKIANELKRSRKSINDFLEKTKTTGNFADQNCKKGRWPKGSIKLNERQKRLLRSWLKDGKLQSARQCYIRLNKIKNLPYASYKSVNSYLKTIGGFVRPKLKSLVSPANKSKRLNYCNDYKDFNFHKVLFTDESSFQLNANNLKMFRFKGRPPPKITKFNPNYSIMVWGGISHQGKTTLKFIDGKVNAEKYQEIVMSKKTEILKLFNKRGRWFFLQDNAPCHRPERVKQFIKEQLSCDLIPHPPQSPDLNPIELVWAAMKVQVEAKRPRNKTQLKDAIEKAWKAMNINFIRKCIDNLQKKMLKIIDCNGELL